MTVPAQGGKDPKNPWGGRFSGAMDPEVNRYTESTEQDAAFFVEDVRGSIAHAAMLADRGLITQEDAARLITGLETLLADWQAGKLSLDPALEDVHMNIERLLEQRVGEPARRLHTARSRNDQVATAFRLYVRRRIGEIRAALADLGRLLCTLAERHAKDLLPGYTHLQRAQPVTLGFHLLTYAEMLRRDDERLADALKRLNVSPLGAGALAGTTLPIDRGQTAAALGFDGPIPHSMDAVSDRDFALEFLAAGAILMTHLSRLAEELVLWSSQEFGFISFADTHATGSSMMPQKKNPDIPELVRGRTGRTYGNLINLLVTLKGLPLAYNRDLQEDKRPVIDTADVCAQSLRIMTGLLQATTFHLERMADAAADRNLCATELAEYLVEQGVPFREAHRIVGELVARVGGDLNRATWDDLAAVSPQFKPDAMERLDAARAVAARSLPGGPAPDNVRRRAAELHAAFRADAPA